MIPKYKIEVYDNSGNLRYTITDDAKYIHVKEVATDNVGLFSFILPTVKGSPSQGYMYNDINLFNKVKIYFWYGESESCPSTPTFVGWIYKITAPLNTESGYVRIFQGKSLGEILQRRVITSRAWEDTAASTIVTELATDLGLGTSQIESDSTPITLIVDHESYFDVIRKISDYWVDASTQIKKDFYVDVNHNLVWKSRPLRTSGVAALTVGQDIISYSATRSVEDVKNKITVYGQNAHVGEPGVQGRTYPVDGDAWTEAMTGWTLEEGYNFLCTPYVVKVGSVSIEIYAHSSTGKIKFRRSSSFNIPFFGEAAYQTINFYWRNYNYYNSSGEVRLYAPDSSNYFYAPMTLLPLDEWKWHSFSLGPNQEYDADKRPNAPWRKTGNPSWNRICNVCFYVSTGNQSKHWLDGFHFGHGRWRSTVEDSASKNSYGVREYVLIDNALKSDSDCEKRAQTLLYQLKNPPIRLDVTTIGNTNIKVGDRLNITIPAEGISNESFDVVAVEHVFNSNGFLTMASMVNTADTRRPIPVSNAELLRSKFDVQREIARGVQLVK